MAPRWQWESMFLDALRNSGLVRASARAVGVGRRTVYDRRKADPVFAADWDKAMQPFHEGVYSPDRAALARFPAHAALAPLAKLSAQVGAVTVAELETRLGSSLEDYAAKLERLGTADDATQRIATRLASEIRGLARTRGNAAEIPSNYVEPVRSPEEEPDQRVEAGPDLCGNAPGPEPTKCAPVDPDRTTSTEPPDDWDPPESLDRMQF